MARKRRKVADPFDQLHMDFIAPTHKAPRRPAPVRRPLPRAARPPRFATAPDGTRTSQTSMPLASEFGRRYAAYLFGAEAVASLPHDAKGNPLGCVSWLRAVSGWGGRGAVVRCWVATNPRSPYGLVGMWNGRMQPLDAPRDALGPDARQVAA